ncbi:MAG: divalent-cation tolerance protein CutA [Proteobacteria bacterium]|nr:divalent-cation tolerance protein CutA [Pseudomonadota bacterium]
MQNTPYCIVTTTVADIDQASRLARAIVEAGLGACVQIDSVRSIYRWEGRVCDEPECRLTIKTREQRYDALARFIAERHPYQSPEIVRLDLTDGSAAYLRWIDEQTAVPPEGSAET